VLCGVGACWVAGTDPAKRDGDLWRHWTVFWVGTGAYWLISVLDPKLYFGLASVGLYVGTAALLIGLLRSQQRWTISNLAVYVVSGGLVAVAALTDWALVWKRHNSGAHQLLCAVVLALWAWRLRLRDETKSLIMLTYAAAQLPLQPILASLGMTHDQYLDFVARTGLLYASLKVTLIPAVCESSKLSKPA
jgi:hypothetical protein